MEVTLPCGLVEDGNHVRNVLLDEMTGFEEDMMADPNKIRSGNVTTELLARCTAKIGGTEAPSDRKERVKLFSPKLKKMLLNDRHFLLVRLRQISLGDEFKFEASCPDCKRHSANYSIKLSELKVKEMNTREEDEEIEYDEETGEELKKQAAPKEDNTLTLPSGKVVVWRHLTGEDELALSMVRKERPADAFSAILFRRIKTIDGAKPVGVGAIKQLSVRDRDAFRDEIDRVEGGIDTDINIDCPFCLHSWILTLPVDQQSFFFPSGIR